MKKWLAKKIKVPQGFLLYVGVSFAAIAAISAIRIWGS